MRYSTNKEIDKEHKRTGKCKQCDKCCTLSVYGWVSKERMKYLSGFGFESMRIGEYTRAVLNKPCKHLTKDNKCSVWGTKDLPQACKQFPCPDDTTYKFVKKTCGFKFNKKKTLHMGLPDN